MQSIWWPGLQLEKAQAEIGLLKEELATLHEEGKSLRLQLDEVKAATVNAISEYQSSEEMAASSRPFMMKVTRRPQRLSHILWRPYARTGTWVSSVRI